MKNQTLMLTVATLMVAGLTYAQNAPVQTIRAAGELSSRTNPVPIVIPPINSPALVPAVSNNVSPSLAPGINSNPVSGLNPRPITGYTTNVINGYNPHPVTGFAPISPQLYTNRPPGK